ncbi:SDR family oxidoreductase [Ferruginibacter sp. HRS2-29]|uniref:SDR family oxidoreductase n=1 Tax=Ferruginibacter sp. HRS2-29 TaxID=2487334 RepID=UPI0020CFC0CB|nr:SDR family oxidoreductase [Ferruginibacter sp. HRS2-29]MCP9750468.1 SDR family oxidoreductase [Ferruginibacter sp. HRS2-29]
MNVVITGASKGIGKAIAEKFASENNRVFLCARTDDELQDTAAEIRERYPFAEVFALAADLTKKEDITRFAEMCLDFGTPDILVNNTGRYIPGKIATEADDALEEMIRTNLYSAYYLTRHLLPAMTANGSGHIFNICSVASLNAYEGGGSYSISKYALNGFSQNLRHELRSTGIKVTAVYPGAVFTDSWAGFDNSSNRIMESSDIAESVISATRLSSQAVVESIILRPQLGDL